MVRVLVVGCGNMGRLHAMAYHQLPDFQLVGLVSRGPSATAVNEELGGSYAVFSNFEDALSTSRPDAVAICTYPDTHYSFARRALESGRHVFVEKPLAETVEQAEDLVRLAQESDLTMVVGYILRVHPVWTRFVDMARELGKPLVMRMNLNQQSHGESWQTHLALMQSMSPIVDCGVHYVDMMCQMTQSRPLSVSAIGVRLTDDVPQSTYNYGQLQVRFEDGSVGWYEAGWGPMMSETAHFIKDVIGPKGAVSIVNKSEAASDDVDAHVGTEQLLWHRATTDSGSQWQLHDEWIVPDAVPDHAALCRMEQQFFRDAMQARVAVDRHLSDAVDSLRIVLAADESVRSGKTVYL